MSIKLTIIALSFLLLFSCSSNSRYEMTAADSKYLAGTADSKAVLKALAEQKGKVVLLNIWATWCDPCIEEFPDLIAFHNKYNADGLEVIGVTMDFFVADADSFLATLDVGFVNLFKDDEQDDDSFIRDLGDEWLGALPATWVYNREGEKVYFHMERFDTEELEKVIVEQLKK